MCRHMWTSLTRSVKRAVSWTTTFLRPNSAKVFCIGSAFCSIRCTVQIALGVCTLCTIVTNLPWIGQLGNWVCNTHRQRCQVDSFVCSTHPHRGIVCTHKNRSLACPLHVPAIAGCSNEWDAMLPGGAVSLHCSWCASPFLAGYLHLQTFEGSPGQGLPGS